MSVIDETLYCRHGVNVLNSCLKCDGEIMYTQQDLDQEVRAAEERVYIALLTPKGRNDLFKELEAKRQALKEGDKL